MSTTKTTQQAVGVEPTISEQGIWLGQLSLQLEHSDSPDRPMVTAILQSLHNFKELRSLLAASREALEAGAAALNIEAMSVRNSLPSSHAASDALNERATTLRALAHLSGEAS